MFTAVYWMEIGAAFPVAKVVTSSLGNVLYQYIYYAPGAPPLSEYVISDGLLCGPATPLNN
jgi:hypothetical protein